jgi:CRISP-associated protein Cas1
MKSLYISQQNCYISLKKETLLIKKKDNILNTIQLPLIEQILIFGQSQITTQAIRSCLKYNIPILYLSRMGYCYGRIIAIERGYRQLSRHQQQIDIEKSLIVAKNIIKAKLHNSKTILQRQQRNHNLNLQQTIDSLNYLQTKAQNADTIQQLFGYEGVGANMYFTAFGECLQNTNFIFLSRSRRPPTNPTNALLSFGYQVLWNHILTLIEFQGLDPYYSCLHQFNPKHPSLASDLIEEFRAGIVDSLILYLIKKNMIHPQSDFTYQQGGCFLNDSGRKKYLQAFMQKMEETVTNHSGEKVPRWDLLNQQVKKIKQFFYQPTNTYQPYLFR